MVDGWTFLSPNLWNLVTLTKVMKQEDTRKEFCLEECQSRAQYPTKSGQTRFVDDEIDVTDLPVVID